MPRVKAFIREAFYWLRVSVLMSVICIVSMAVGAALSPFVS